MTWTAAGPLIDSVSTFASGFSQPLGLVFGSDGALYVADSVLGAESGRLDGRVSRVENGVTKPVVSGIPNGRHNTNNLRIGPDARLYIANGNPNDNGIVGGEVDVFPYSGAILAVDPDVVSASPTTLHWRAGGAPIPTGSIPTHASNADFASKVDVIGFGFRNVYDVAFSPSGEAYTATNGADVPASQDVLYKITPGADHGFPFCYAVGPAGGVGSSVSVEANPTFGDDARCEGVPPPTALLGWHVCATGLDFPTEGEWGFSGAWRRSVYIAECGPFFPDDLLQRLAAAPLEGTHSTGHKVARVGLDENGDATVVHDFVTGLALPTDVLFGPDGAMYIADAEAIHRVAPLPLPGPALAITPSPPPIVAAPGAWVSNYATPVAAVPVGGALQLVNADIMRHNVVAYRDFGDGTAPWCESYLPGRCPLFWSRLIDVGQTTDVLGLDRLEATRTYEFYCTIHPSMRGTLVALPRLE